MRNNNCPRIRPILYRLGTAGRDGETRFDPGRIPLRFSTGDGTGPGRFAPWERPLCMAASASSHDEFKEPDFESHFRAMLDTAKTQLLGVGFVPFTSTGESDTDSSEDDAVENESRRRRSRLGLTVSLLSLHFQRAKRTRLNNAWP